MKLQARPHECLLLLVRHGATPANLEVPHRLQGQGVNQGLSELGQRQAVAVAEFLATQPIENIYSSSLNRAHETAIEIARHHALTPTLKHDLREVDVGDWSGKTWDEIRVEDPELYRANRENPAENPHKNGECYRDVLARTLPILQEIMRENQGRVVCVVAHKIVNATLLSHFMDLELQYVRRIPQENCGVNLLRWYQDATQVLTLNAAFHLADHAFGKLPAKAFSATT